MTAKFWLSIRCVGCGDLYRERVLAVLDGSRCPECRSTLPQRIKAQVDDGSLYGGGDKEVWQGEREAKRRGVEIVESEALI